MGKPTGFMEYDRQLPGDRSPLERIKDWDEFHQYLTEEEMRHQGARCMDCGVPFCHSGMLLAGMVSGCPLNNLIPEWNDLIYRGQWHQAVKRLLKTNNFPEFTGRVCPAPCEGSCALGLNNPQVTIKNNECSIIDRAFSEDWMKVEPPAQRTGKKVAIIGSGPSGLACADQLNKSGHLVTVFERADRVGGLLMYGIPNMKLDKRIIQRRIDLMAQSGVQFTTTTEVGVDYPVDRIQEEYDAVVLCGGATKPRDLPVEGRELEGVHFAVDFLTTNTRTLLDNGSVDNTSITAKDKDVIVIGGGDTGTDCVGTAIRQGCGSVVQFEIMPEPPLVRTLDNPWPQWPKVKKVDYGQEEAAVLYGSDPRNYQIATKRLVGDEHGRVKEVHTVQVEWEKDENGRYVMQELPGTERVWPAKLVLLALGFLGPEDTLLTQLEVERTQRSNIKTPEGSYATSTPGVFAAGDMRRGQSLVVWAIKEGRGAANEVNQYLMKG